MTERPHGFSKTRRLTETLDYKRVQSSGRRSRTRTLTVYVCPGTTDRVRVGLTVSRKVGNAVVRNRVKRRLREAVRKHYLELSSPVDIVFVATPRTPSVCALDLEDEVRVALSQIRRSPR